MAQENMKGALAPPPPGIGLRQILVHCPCYAIAPGLGGYGNGLAWNFNKCLLYFSMHTELRFIITRQPWTADLSPQHLLKSRRKGSSSDDFILTCCYNCVHLSMHNSQFFSIKHHITIVISLCATIYLFWASWNLGMHIWSNIINMLSGCVNMF